MRAYLSVLLGEFTNWFMNKHKMTFQYRDVTNKLVKG